MTAHTKTLQPYRIKLQGSGYYPYEEWSTGRRYLTTETFFARERAQVDSDRAKITLPHAA